MIFLCLMGKLLKIFSRSSARAWFSHGAADGEVIVSVAPIGRNAVQKALDALGEKQKMQILPFTYHSPALGAPRIGILQQEIRGKAEVYGLPSGFILYAPDFRCLTGAENASVFVIAAVSTPRFWSPL